MKIDDFKIAQLNIQLTYKPAYVLWDRAGSTTRELSAIWPNAELLETEPNQQILKSPLCRLTTSLSKSHIGITKLSTFDQHHDKIKRTYETWVSALELQTVDQLSARAMYHFVQPSIEQANAILLAAEIVKWPKRKVFNQSESSPKNAVGISYQLEDDATRTIFRIRTESLKFELSTSDAIQEFEPIIQEQHRIVLDIDRIVLKPIQITELSIIDWLEGFQHLIRRDASEFF